MIAAYLSAPSAETPRAREVRAALEAEGVCAFGSAWIEHVERHGSEGIGLADRDAIPSRWRSCIRRSHVLLVLAPLGTTSAGIYREFEMAIAADVPVVVSCCAPPERVPLALLDREARLAGRWHHELDDVSAVALAVRIARREATPGWRAW